MNELKEYIEKNINDNKDWSMQQQMAILASMMLKKLSEDGDEVVGIIRF